MADVSCSGYFYMDLSANETKHAKERNAQVLARPNTIGVGLTDPKLIARCSLGNINAWTSSKNSLVEIALEYPLPPVPATFLCMGPWAELGPVAAMAVFELRRRGVELTDGLFERIQLVAKTTSKVWPGVRPLPTHDGPWIDRNEETSAVVEKGIFWPGIQKSVQDAMCSWLETGHVSLESLVNSTARQHAWDERRNLLDYLEKGWLDVWAHPSHKLAIVHSSHWKALKVGFWQAPVVVLVNENFYPTMRSTKPQRRITVTQYVPGYLDMEKLASELNRKQRGWRRTPTQVVSAKTRSCQLKLDDVVGATVKNLIKEV